jgi:hypothetical protein
MTRAGVWGLVVVAACGGSPRAVPGRAEALTRRTQSGAYTVALSFEPTPPPVGALFAVQATVTQRDGTPLELGTVALDARMPQHNHGMETDPVDLPGVCEDADTEPAACPHPGGVYRTEGFKFHMPGAWTVTVDVRGARGPDSTSFVVEIP